MKYIDFVNHLNYCIRLLKENDIMGIDSNLLRIMMENNNNYSLLFFKLHQIKGLTEFKELIELFKLYKYVRKERQLDPNYKLPEYSLSSTYRPNREDDSVYDGICNKIFSDCFEENPIYSQRDVTKYINDQETHNKIEKVVQLFKDYIENRSNKGLFDDIKRVCGESVFEKIRYTLNSELDVEIIDMYLRMLDKHGNLYDVDTFIKIVSLNSIDDFHLCRNVIENLNNTKTNKDYAFSLIKGERFKELYEYYNSFVTSNPLYVDALNATNEMLRDDILVPEKVDKVLSLLEMGSGSLSDFQLFNTYILDRDISESKKTSSKKLLELMADKNKQLDELGLSREQINKNIDSIQESSSQLISNYNSVLSELLSHPSYDESKDLELVKRLLEKGANSYSECVEKAIEKKCYKTILLFLSFGFDPNTLLSKGFALMHESHNINSELPDILLSLGANINVINIDENTPLMLAIYQRNINFVKYLLSKNASIYIVNSNGETALDIAQSIGNEDIINLLKNEELIETGDYNMDDEMEDIRRLLLEI